MKTIWYWCKDWQIDQWNRREPINRPITLSTFDIQQRWYPRTVGKRQSFNKQCWGNWVSRGEKMESDLLWTLCTKMNSSGLKTTDPGQNSKDLEGDVEEHLHGLGGRGGFLNPDTKTIHWESEIYKFESITIKNICSIKDTLREQRDKPQSGNQSYNS